MRHLPLQRISVPGHVYKSWSHGTAQVRDMRIPGNIVGLISKSHMLIFIKNTVSLYHLCKIIFQG